MRMRLRIWQLPFVCYTQRNAVSKQIEILSIIIEGITGFLAVHSFIP